MYIGGALLFASVVVVVTLQPGLTAILGIEFLPACVFSVALVVLAIGSDASGSVTARRPLGTLALIALAIWLVLGSLVDFIIGSFFRDLSSSEFLTKVDLVDLAVQFALALIAVIQIARAGVVPPRWNWVPAYVLAAVTASWLLMYLIGNDTIDADLTTVVLLNVEGIARTGGTLVLGVVAILVADRAGRPTEPQVPTARQVSQVPQVGAGSERRRSRAR
jgi:hypothetical protein